MNFPSFKGINFKNLDDLTIGWSVISKELLMNDLLTEKLTMLKIWNSNINLDKELIEKIKNLPMIQYVELNIKES